MPAPLRIRDAERADVELLFSRIGELAEYEEAGARVLGTPELLEEALFGPSPVAEAVIAELAGHAVGHALFFTTFSTWLCLPGLWLEELYVSPRHRREGVGEALLAHVAGLAVRRGYGRLDWAVLNWNTPALNFYEKLGATVLDEWHLHRLDGAALEQAALGRSRAS